MNLMPLLDVLFNLIFFFLLATTIKESQSLLDVSLPYSEQAQVQEQQQVDNMVITVNGDNEIFLRGKKTNIDKLEQEIKNLTPETSIDNVVIKGDARAHHQTIIHVLDACAAAQLYKVSVEVLPEQ